MQHRLLGALVCAMLSSALPATAAPVTVNAGESVVFNFSGTSAVAGDLVELTISFIGVSADAAGSYTFYPDLDAGGTPWSMTAPFNLSVQDFLQTGPAAAPAGFFDGTFSALLTMTAGSMEIEPSVTLITNRDVGTVYRVTIGTTPANTVDEPSVMALLAALGLGATGARRRTATARA